ncbi:hypothetical protein GCM10011573_03250 [Enterococcus wangshanyuanii]|uniref:Uncharacterized protein n=1 Tax=Enterococcus wangshanyuanii TaxID=2005703 RepID=A0ABQ1NH23_9ENTE|nr:hypothetical protein GCM10011573_03250 [Enterococcus wangshanyuanii]
MTLKSIDSIENLPKKQLIRATKREIENKRSSIKNEKIRFINSSLLSKITSFLIYVRIGDLSRKEYLNEKKHDLNQSFKSCLFS